MSGPPRWEHLEGRAPRSLKVDGVTVGRGSRVVLRPRAGADVFDLALAGKVGVVERIEEDLEGVRHLAVVLEDDPGRDLGEALQPGHRFFFGPDEVEPLAGDPPPLARVLVAGIGNVFLGDDAFGVELATRLAGRSLPGGVEVADFGIRGMDLAFALQEDLDAAVLLDAVPRGGDPGTLYVIEPELEDGAAAAVEAHAMDPVKVLALARQLGRLPARVLVVGCEPAWVGSVEDGEMGMELSEPVRAALDPAVTLVEELLDELTAGHDDERRGRWAS